MSIDSIVRGWFDSTLAKAPPPNQLSVGIFLQRNIPELVASLEALSPPAAQVFHNAPAAPPVDIPAIEKAAEDKIVLAAMSAEGT